MASVHQKQGVPCLQQSTSVGQHKAGKYASGRLYTLDVLQSSACFVFNNVFCGLQTKILRRMAFRGPFFKL